jgi:hypothetical protein
LVNHLHQSNADESTAFGHFCNALEFSLAFESAGALNALI